MKKSSLYTFMLSACLLVAGNSCSKFLDKEPNQLSTSTYYNSDQEAEAAINAAYSIFYNFFQNHTGFDVDCLSDDIIKGHGTDFSDYNSYNTGQIKASDGAVKSYWNDYYQGIYRANLVLDYVPNGKNISIKMKDQSLGEAHFLRAYFYFQLVQRFGGVPKITSTIDSESEPARTSKDEIYTLIVQDLKDAIEKLPYIKDAGVGRPNKGAAQSLLGLVYLSQNKYAEVYQTLKPIVDNEGGKYNYALIKDLSQMYQLSNNNGPESIFEIQSRQAAPIGQTVAFNHWIRPRGMPKRGGLGFPMPTQSLYNEFEQGDKRREATILKNGDFIANELVRDNSDPILFESSWSPETGMNMAKYVKWVDVGDYQERLGQNKKLIRFAEVLLAFAEAANVEGKQSEADNALLKIRQRAFGMTTPPIYSTDFKKAIRHERRVELATENHRYFDLVRWGLAATVLTKDCKRHPNYNLDYIWNETAKGLFPIPQSELDVDKNPNFKQNPGY